VSLFASRAVKTFDILVVALIFAGLS